MFSDHEEELREKTEQSRRDGYMVFSVAEGPIPLGCLVRMVQDIFPNHSLDQIAITEIDGDDEAFVVAAKLGIETKSN